MKRTEITCPNGHEEFEVEILGTKPDPQLLLKCEECGANKTIPILIGLWTTSSWAPEELSIDEEATEELHLPEPEKFPEPGNREIAEMSKEPIKKDGFFGNPLGIRWTP